MTPRLFYILPDLSVHSTLRLTGASQGQGSHCITHDLCTLVSGAARSPDQRNTYSTDPSRRVQCRAVVATLGLASVIETYAPCLNRPVPLAASLLDYVRRPGLLAQPLSYSPAHQAQLKQR